MDTFEDFLNSEDMNYLRTKYKDKDKNKGKDLDLDLDLDQLISIGEFQAIFNGIEKTDYTQYGLSRWRDLEQIINDIIERKKEHKICKLKKLFIEYSLETFIPYNKYCYQYE